MTRRGRLLEQGNLLALHARWSKLNRHASHHRLKLSHGTIEHGFLRREPALQIFDLSLMAFQLRVEALIAGIGLQLFLLQLFNAGFERRD